MVDRVSEAEGSCVSWSMGDAGYQLFRGAPLTASAADASAKTIFADCLENDNLLVLGVGLMSAHQGRWSEESLGCVTSLSREHPELVHLALGIEWKIPDPSHPTEIHSIILNMYECLTGTERVGFSVAITTTSLEVAPFSGQHFLAALPQTEIECLQTNLPEPVFAMIASTPSVAGGELRDVPPQLMACISAESLARLPGEVMAHGLGVTSDDSHACIVEFAVEHSHYVELACAAVADPTALTPE